MPRKTDANNPYDWIWLAEADLEMIRSAAPQRIAYTACRSKLAEALEKIMKAELIRLGWTLERTHDLEHLLDELIDRRSDLVSELDQVCDSLADAYFSDRYPGFDLEDPDWPLLTAQLDTVSAICRKIGTRVKPDS